MFLIYLIFFTSKVFDCEAKKKNEKAKDWMTVWSEYSGIDAEISQHYNTLWVFPISVD